MQNLLGQFHAQSHACNNRRVIIIAIKILMVIKARKLISHIIMHTKFVYKDDTVILFLRIRCWKAHDTHLLKMYVR